MRILVELTHNHAVTIPMISDLQNYPCYIVVLCYTQYPLIIIIRCSGWIKISGSENLGPLWRGVDDNQ